MDRFFVIILIKVISLSPILAQNPFDPVIGYRSILEKKYKTRPPSVEVQYLDELIGVTLDRRNEKNLLVPLELIENSSDTLILFCNTKDLRRVNKKSKVQFSSTNSMLRRIAAREYRKVDLKPSKEYDLDSIFQHMEQNMTINSAIFDMDRYLDNNESNICCKPRDFDEQSRMIYYLFINGILTVERTYSGTLHYVAY